MVINIPYGDSHLELKLPPQRLRATLKAKETGMGSDPRQIVRGALARPIGSDALSALARNKNRITIITSDHTRPMPSAVTMPILLEEIRKGSPEAEITILVATGMHRATTEEELRDRFGESIYKNEKIIVHDSKDDSALRNIGKLPSGGTLVLSKYALDTDLLIAEGFIEPHFFAGFSGGRKSVLPGVAGYECVISNHCSEFIADKKAVSGGLAGNPIHMDMAYAAGQSGLAFILNVMLGGNRTIVDAVAGDPFEAHEEGCRRLMSRVSFDCDKAPIVITSNGGYPLDQNLYQLVKCMDTASKCCLEGGVIIAVGECRDGTGGDGFYNDFAGGKRPDELLKRFMATGRLDTKADQWQSQVLARIIEKYRVIVVAPLIEGIVRGMNLGWAASLDAALEQAGGGEVIVIPDGPGVIVTSEGS